MLYKNNFNDGGCELVWQDELKVTNLTDQMTFDLGTGAPSFKEYGQSSPYFVPEISKR